jgi:hypothetical protein
MLVQVAPGHARPCDPENPIEDEAVISRAPPAARPALDHKRLKTRPFLVAHQTPDQDSLPLGYLRDAGPLRHLARGYPIGGCETVARTLAWH